MHADVASPVVLSRCAAVAAVLVALMALVQPAQADIAVRDQYGNYVVQSLKIHRPGEPRCRAVADCEEAADYICRQPMRLFGSESELPCDNVCSSPAELKALLARSDCGDGRTDTPPQ